MQREWTSSRPARQMQARSRARLAAEAERARGEIETSRVLPRRRQIVTAKSRRGRRVAGVCAGLADATAEADRRVVAETDRSPRARSRGTGPWRVRAMKCAATWTGGGADRRRAPREMERAVTHATTSLRARWNKRRIRPAARLREEMDSAERRRTRAGAPSSRASARASRSCCRRARPRRRRNRGRATEGADAVGARGSQRRAACASPEAQGPRP